jgi:hypothetical protein
MRPVHVSLSRVARGWLPAAPADETGATRQRRASPSRPTLLTLLVTVILAACSSSSTATNAPAAAAPAPTRALTPSTLALSPGDPQVLKGGAYLVSDPFPISVTVTVPAGWTGELAGPYAVFLDNGGTSGRATVTLTLSQSIYADPCTDRGFLKPQPGPTVDDLAFALARLPGFAATSPTDLTVAGFRGRQLTLTAPDDFDSCLLSPDGYRIWQLPEGHVFSFAPGEHMALWILDVNGKRLVVSRETLPGTTAQDQAQVQAIMDSMRIENPN